MKNSIFLSQLERKVTRWCQHPSANFCSWEIKRNNLISECKRTFGNYHISFTKTKLALRRGMEQTSYFNLSNSVPPVTEFNPITVNISALKKKLFYNCVGNRFIKRKGKTHTHRARISDLTKKNSKKRVHSLHLFVYVFCFIHLC